ncbi:hypothetical protein Tco_1433484 [Tanacetum coccineum]
MSIHSSFHCSLYAKIHKIHRENGWTYLACNRCGRSANEVDDDQSSSSGKRGKKQKLWYCKVHKALTASGVGMRWTHYSRLLLLRGEQCVRLIRQHGENYDDYFPDELNVEMLSQDEAMITMLRRLLSETLLYDPEVDPQTPVPSNANSSRFTNVDNIPFKINETPKSSYVASKGNASHGYGEHNSMSVESDAGGSGRKTNIH